MEDAKGFIDCAGIESPGLTSAPAIGEMIAQILKEKMNLEEKEDFIATRKGILDPNTLSKEERIALIRWIHCSPRTMEILARERHVSMFDITKSGGNSRIVTDNNKDSL